MADEPVIYSEDREWRLELPGGDVWRWTTHDVGEMRQGGYEWDGLVEPKPGETPEATLQRYIAERN